MPDFSLQGRKALVTGGNSGIGLGIARGLAEAGAAVAIVGKNAARNTEALRELSPLHAGCRAYAFDLMDTKGIAGSYDEISKEMGGIDVCVTAAGATSRVRADLADLDDFQRLMNLNVNATFAVSQAFARERIKAGKPGGSLILIASLMSEGARPTNAPYCATKGAVRQLVKSMAVDWAQFGVRVNGIGPGYIRTRLTQALWEDVKFTAWVESRTPLARWGNPEDLAGAAVFLASPASAFITGQILYVDGGWLSTF
jgi:gluconate 5-dehydrogenase